MLNERAKFAAIKAAFPNGNQTIAQEICVTDAIAAYLSALLPEDVAGLVERLLTDSKGSGNFVAVVPLHGLRHEAASLIQSQAARERALEAALVEALRLLGRYRTETPLGNQPHMIALEAETFAASARSLLNGERKANG